MRGGQGFTGSANKDYYDVYLRGFQKLAVLFWGSSKKTDYSILGCISASPYLGKLPFLFITDIRVSGLRV